MIFIRIATQRERANSDPNLDFVDIFNERFKLLNKFQDDPAKFFKEAKISYLAPLDAAHTNLEDTSIDFHFSMTVLEHIPAAILRDIFKEAKRILKPNGLAIHFIDLSDHFQHTDPSITRINFLKYSESEWQNIAGNEFAYCNRMRVGDFIELFNDVGFEIVHKESIIDDDSCECIANRGVLLDEKFRKMSLEEICTSSFRVILKQANI